MVSVLRRADALSALVDDETAFQRANAPSVLVDLVAEFGHAPAALVVQVERGAGRADAVAVLVLDESFLDQTLNNC